MATKITDIFKIGDLLNQTYRIEGILGRGGTSEVYKARSEISGRVMAVKALRVEFSNNDDFLTLMTREENIRDVRHDAIVRYFDTQRMPNGVVYLVMELVEGPNLEAKSKSGGMAASELMIVGERLAEGLIAAHDRNIVHRDLSPDNIILRNDNPADPVIIDFGIAKDTNPGAETIVGNEFAGKYAYAAPEQLSGNADPRSDIYSLGALLLSTFRGEKPDIGNNPMEVLQKKSEPLEVEGVPEPLRSTILKMSHPDPTQRFQSARELVEVFKNPEILDVISNLPLETLDDATVMASSIPSANISSAREYTASISMSEDNNVSKATPIKKRSQLLPILGVIVLISLVAGSYISGVLENVFGPSYPLAEPFTMHVERREDGSISAKGNVPSPEVEAALSALIQDMGGEVDLALAKGDIGDNWGSGFIRIVTDTSLLLDEFDITVFDDSVSITGLAEHRAKKLEFENTFRNGFPIGFTGTTKIILGPRFLSTSKIETLLNKHEDCGQLNLLSTPLVGYGLNDRIVVTGRFAETASRDRLKSAISDLAGERPVRVEADILNPSLCLIDVALHNSKSNGFNVRFGFGDRSGENETGVYVVGDNPVIDVAMPKLIDTGYLYVSVIDVKGVVYHILPNRTRPKNSIDALKLETRNGFVRAAYSIDEARVNGQIAFTVDDSLLGKSKVVVLYSDKPLFEDLRPTSESTESYVEALKAVEDTGKSTVSSVDSALIITKR